MSLLTRLLARGTVVLANSATKLQSLQMRLTAGEVNDDMEHFEPYGFTSNPLAGAEGIATFLGGDRSHAIVLVVADRRYRLQSLAAGEVAIYTDEGDKIHFKRGRIIDIETATLNIRARPHRRCYALLRDHPAQGSGLGGKGQTNAEARAPRLFQGGAMNPTALKLATGGVDHGAPRARLDPAHAQRIIAITDTGDSGLIALQACQAYVRALAR